MNVFTLFGLAYFWKAKHKQYIVYYLYLYVPCLRESSMVCFLKTFFYPSSKSRFHDAVLGEVRWSIDKITGLATTANGIAEYGCSLEWEISSCIFNEVSRLATALHTA